MRLGHEDIKRGKEALARLSRSVDLETGLSALWQGRHRQENMLNHKWLDVSQDRKTSREAKRMSGRLTRAVCYEIGPSAHGRAV